MKTVNKMQAINVENGCAVALGYFDGLHLGHRAVIEAAVKCARINKLSSALLTFTLPNKQKTKGLAILQNSEKQRRAKLLAVDYYVCPEFESLRSLSPEEFVKTVLSQGLKARAVFCGENYTFGANKTGNITLLTKLCKPLGISVNIVPTTEYDCAPVSSTRIRALLESGNLQSANEMLIKPYAICLPVIHGKELARKLGVPTMNQVYKEGMLVPKSGVYATRVTIDDIPYVGATGLGNRPTVNGEGITCETFVKGFNGSLYGRKILVEFLRYLRPTEKFENLDMLRDCILNAAWDSERINGYYLNI